MDKGVGERLIRQVVTSTVGACEACSQPFDESSASVVGHQDDLWFISLTCAQCQTRVLVAALIQENAPVAVADSPASGRTSRVDSEDVLAVRQFLDAFDGDFRALFC
jgi:hypothetical protein